MKCPTCGQELTQSKKDPNYLLCYDCKKKYKAPAKKASEKTKVVKKDTEEKVQEQKYSNIPPKKVRDKRETEMRKAYDEMLSVENETKKKRKKKKPEPKAEVYADEYDDYNLDYTDEEDSGGSKVPIILLAIAIVIVILVIAYMLLFR